MRERLGDRAHEVDDEQRLHAIAAVADDRYYRKIARELGELVERAVVAAIHPRRAKDGGRKPAQLHGLFGHELGAEPRLAVEVRAVRPRAGATQVDETLRAGLARGLDQVARAFAVELLV